MSGTIIRNRTSIALTITMASNKPGRIENKKNVGDIKDRFRRLSGPESSGTMGAKRIKVALVDTLLLSTAAVEIGQLRIYDKGICSALF
jgi:hypothetical protein